MIEYTLVELQKSLPYGLAVPLRNEPFNLSIDECIVKGFSYLRRTSRRTWLVSSSGGEHRRRRRRLKPKTRPATQTVNEYKTEYVL